MHSFIAFKNSNLISTMKKRFFSIPSSTCFLRYLPTQTKFICYWKSLDSLSMKAYLFVFSMPKCTPKVIFISINPFLREIKTSYLKIFTVNIIHVKNFYSVTVLTSQPLKSRIPIILRKDGKYISSKL